MMDAEVSTQEFFANARDFYGLLSSLYYVELTQEQIDALAAMPLEVPEDGSEWAAACVQLKRYLQRRGSNARQDLACDYARIFLAAGVYDGKTAVPFESVYTSDEGILMQDSRDDVVKIMAQNGFAVEKDLNVPEDHLAFELEFMALLCGRIVDALEGADAGEGKEAAQAALPLEAIRDMQTQLAFIDEHLLNWVPQLAARVVAFAELPFYPAMMNMTLAYIAEHRAVLAEVLA